MFFGYAAYNFPIAAVPVLANVALIAPPATDPTTGMNFKRLPAANLSPKPVAHTPANPNATFLADSSLNSSP
ncbi:MAG: hypothetical protein SOW07_00420 [Helicobacter sp.]|nr:hypothetical protein [Helicobacter sp.]MCI5968095.1 hypothetical protein [Helicobacter sp.]MDY2584103.1 hypothetical protein [Helicobacter sp.]